MNEKDPNGIDPHEPGAKLDDGKNRLGLVILGFPNAIIEVGKVGTYGANKYTDDGWKHVAEGQRRYTDAMLRHLCSEATGEPVDPESGLLHAAHTAWNAIARLELMLSNKEPKKRAYKKRNNQIVVKHAITSIRKIKAPQLHRCLFIQYTEAATSADSKSLQKCGDRSTDLSRNLGAKLAVLKDERIFIDEIPLDHPTTKAIAPECDMLCHLAEDEINAA